MTGECADAKLSGNQTLGRDSSTSDEKLLAVDDGWDIAEADGPARRRFAYRYA
jgi:hypothetical protein